MAELTIRSDLAERLNEIAQHENRPLDEVVESLLSRYEPSNQANASENLLPGTLAKLAQHGRRMHFQASENDISAQSREILEQEWSEHLTRHTDTAIDGSSSN